MVNFESLKKDLTIHGTTYHYYDILKLEEYGFKGIHQLPYTIKILLESLIRQYDGKVITNKHVQDVANWANAYSKDAEVPFKPARVILQDFTGVPVVVDLASMRHAIANLGGDPSLINPIKPVDLVIDHSVQVDHYGLTNSFTENITLEFERNNERYEFLHWAQKSFDNYKAVPPATGIVHQVNLEYLANVVINQNNVLFPDTVVGTDSHTTMINGLGVLGWGVGGIEAEASMLGQASYFPLPEVVGVYLTNELAHGATATDVALKVTKILRDQGVVNKFVEFYGPGVVNLTLADRATISNMAPEYGATCGFFAVDEETLNYMELTGRSKEQIELVRAYCKENHLFFDPTHQPTYTTVVTLDLSEITPSLSGPKRPQDFIALTDMKEKFIESVTAPLGNQGHGITNPSWEKKYAFDHSVKQGELSIGSVVIAAITSCTNTSNPYVLVGAGLLAKKAVELGLSVPNHVKTSLAPGSKVVTSYLQNSGLLPYLEKLGFYLVGYGCTTCIGNSGPLLPEIEETIKENDLLVTSVLSGNRNFEGRIHPLVKANYLASPPLVVAYALAGTVLIDFDKDPIAKTVHQEVYLKDIWPTSKEILEVMSEFVTKETFQQEYENIFFSNDTWNDIQTTDEALYSFDEESTYIQNPPYFENMSLEIEDIQPLNNLKVLASFNDSVTTDHISPAGSIAKHTPAGKYLIEKGVAPKDFNSYGSRRGNHEVMMRGTFANIRIRNLLAKGKEGGYTTYWPTGEIESIYDACMKYKETNTPLVIFAGEDYGMGSSRDWAAKGTALLGVKAVIASSFERIHRSNLVMMGVLPLQFLKGENAQKLGLTGEEEISIELNNDIRPKQELTVTAKKLDGTVQTFTVIARFDSEIEMDYYKHGGILPMVLREMVQK